MKIWAIAMSNVKRMLRERSNIFFVFIFPIAIILLIGVQFGSGFDPIIAVHQEDEGRLATAIVEEISSEDSIEVVVYEASDELIDGIERGAAQGGVLLPAGMDESASAGDVVDISYIARSGEFGVQLQDIVGAAVASVMTPVSAAQFTVDELDADFDQALDVAIASEDAAPGVTVETSAVGEALFPDDFGQFDLGAPSQLVLFVFLTALAGSAALILTRQMGITSRMMSTPTSVTTIVLGEGAGRWATAMVQGLYIMGATLLLFRVNWGDPIAALLVLITFAAVGAGAGLLMGAVFRNDQQAGGVGVVLSIGLAALGGAMMPSEFFGDTLLKIAHLTPHAWAIDAFAELIRRDGTIADISTELAVLVVYAVVLFALAAWRLRVAITRP